MSQQNGPETGKAKIVTGADYIESLRGRNLNVYLFGERVDEPVDHPMIRPSINAVAETYDLAVQHPELGTAVSPFTGQRVNRFLHVANSVEDVVNQNKMQRRLGQLIGTCFQRCVGMDALNALYSVTYEIDEAHGTSYHDRLKTFLTQAQAQNVVIGGAMTDVKGDRSLAPISRPTPICMSTSPGARPTASIFATTCWPTSVSTTLPASLTKSAAWPRTLPAGW